VNKEQEEVKKQSKKKINSATPKKEKKIKEDN
jgi:hypothetical protein